MADGFQWVFELLDKVSGPAKAAHGAVEKLDNVIQALPVHAEKATHKAGGFFHHFFEDLNKGNAKAKKELIEGIAEKFVWLEAIKMAGEFAEKVADIGIELGRDAIKAADFERTAKISFGAMLGDPEEAEAKIKEVQKFALQMGTDYKTTMGQYSSLILAGFEGADVNKLIQGALDLNVFSQGQRSVQSFTDAFADLKTKGKMDARSLGAFQGVLDMDQLAKKLGFATHGFQELRKQLTETPVDSHKALQAVMDLIAAKDGGVAGAAAQKVGMGWEGTVHKLATSWDVFIGTMEETSAFKYLLDIMNRLAVALDPTTESGKAMKRVFEDAFTAVGKFLEPLTKKGGIESAVDSMRQLADAVVRIADGMTGAAKVVGPVLSLMGGAAKAAGSSPVQGLLRSLPVVGDLYGQVTDRIVEGHVNGLLDGIGKVSDASEKLAKEGVIEPHKDALGIHSPSKVFEEMGRYSADGFSIGLAAGSGRLSMPVVASPGGQSSGGRGVTIPITIHASSKEAHDLAEKARDVVLSALAAAFEEVSLEAGVS